MNGREPKRFLLVDDNERDVELTLSALAEGNIDAEVTVVKDGAEALEYLRRTGRFAGRTAGNPSIVLLDVKMPKVNGLEVLRRIKSDQALRMIPVVILTSSREERDLLEAYSAGVNAYVVKPLRRKQFVEAVIRLGIFWAVVNESPPPNRVLSTSS